MHRAELGDTLYGPVHLSLKVQNLEFAFDVSVDSIQLQTDTSKSKYFINIHLSIERQTFEDRQNITLVVF